MEMHSFFSLRTFLDVGLKSSNFYCKIEDKLFCLFVHSCDRAFHTADSFHEAKPPTDRLDGAMSPTASLLAATPPPDSCAYAALSSAANFVRLSNRDQPLLRPNGHYATSKRHLMGQANTRTYVMEPHRPHIVQVQPPARQMGFPVPYYHPGFPPQVFGPYGPWR